jgi:hypothetical protein
MATLPESGDHDGSASLASAPVAHATSGSAGGGPERVLPVTAKNAITVSAP